MSPQDPLFLSLDPLVRDGTLTGGQARRVYERLRVPTVAATTPPPVAADDEPPSVDRRRLLTAAAVVGAGVVSSGLLVSALLAAGNGFHWKTSVPMLLITLGFAAAAVLSRWPLDRRRGVSDLLTGVLLTLAVLSLGVTMVAPQAIEPVIYLAAVVMLVGGLAGYWFLQRDVVTVAAVVGGAVLLGQILSDTVSFGEGGTGPVLLIGVLFLLYGLAVVAAGWMFSCRHLTGILGSVIAVASMHVVALSLLVFGLVSGVNSTADGSAAPLGRGDLKVALVLGMLAAVIVAGLFAYTRRSGYALVSFIGATLLPLLVTIGVTRSHPLRWAVGCAVIGGLVVALAVAERVMANRRQGALPARQQPPQEGSAGSY
jgi:hypothetical protein